MDIQLLILYNGLTGYTMDLLARNSSYIQWIQWISVFKLIHLNHFITCYFWAWGLSLSLSLSLAPAGFRRRVPVLPLRHPHRGGGHVRRLLRAAGHAHGRRAAELGPEEVLAGDRGV